MYVNGFKIENKYIETLKFDRLKTKIFIIEYFPHFSVVEELHASFLPYSDTNFFLLQMVFMGVPRIRIRHSNYRVLTIYIII